MKTFEEIRLNNRQRLVKHIGQAVYHRAPNPEEVFKINRLIDLGKEVSEILSSLQESGEAQKIKSCLVKPKSTSIESLIEASGNRPTFIRTPLENYFHEYVDL